MVQQKKQRNAIFTACWARSKQLRTRMLARSTSPALCRRYSSQGVEERVLLGGEEDDAKMFNIFIDMNELIASHYLMALFS